MLSLPARPAYPLHPCFPRSPGQRIRHPGDRVATPSFPRAKLWWGPRREVEEKLSRGGSGRGRGASHRDWGKGPLGEVPGIRTPAVRAPSPGLAAARKPSPLPPGLKSSRVHHAHCPRERRPLPDSKGGADRPEPQSAPAGGDTGVGGGGRHPPWRVSPKPSWPPGPSPSIPRQQGLSRGAAAQRGGGRGRRQIAKRGNPLRPSWKGGKGKKKRERPGTGERKADRASLDSGWRGGKGTRSAGQARGSRLPLGSAGGGGKVDRPGSPAPDAYEVARVQARVGVRLPGFGVRWVSGRGGWEGGREGRGGGPQPCRSLGRREGRNLW